MGNQKERKVGVSKRCSKCGEPKELDEFVKNKKCKGERAGYCKKCANQYLRKWAENNPDSIKAHKKRWIQNNPEQFGVTKKRSYLKRNRQLVDSVVKTYLQKQFKIKRSEITTKIVEIKRQQIMMWRGVKELKEAVNESN